MVHSGFTWAPISSQLKTMTKTHYVLGEINRVETRAASAAPFNALRGALAPLKQRMEHKKGLGLNPTESKAPAVIANVRAAVVAYHAAVQIELGTDEEIIASLVAADDDTPTELLPTEPAPEPEAVPEPEPAPEPDPEPTP